MMKNSERKTYKETAQKGTGYSNTDGEGKWAEDEEKNLKGRTTA